jgi:hypothetical protein
MESLLTASRLFWIGHIDNASNAPQSIPLSFS